MGEVPPLDAWSPKPTRTIDDREDRCRGREGGVERRRATDDPRDPLGIHDFVENLRVRIRDRCLIELNRWDQYPEILDEVLRRTVDAQSLNIVQRTHAEPHERDNDLVGKRARQTSLEDPGNLVLPEAGEELGLRNFERGDGRNASAARGPTLGEDVEIARGTHAPTGRRRELREREVTRGRVSGRVRAERHVTNGGTRTHDLIDIRQRIGRTPQLIEQRTSVPLIQPRAPEGDPLLGTRGPRRAQKRARPRERNERLRPEPVDLNDRGPNERIRARDLAAELADIDRRVTGSRFVRATTHEQAPLTLIQVREQCETRAESRNGLGRKIEIRVRTTERRSQLDRLERGRGSLLTGRHDRTRRGSPHERRTYATNGGGP